MANLDELLHNGPQALELLSDKELELIFAPYLNVTRIDPAKRSANATTQQSKKPTVGVKKHIKEADLLARLKEMGV